MSGISRKEFYEKAMQDPALGEKLAALSREFDEKLRALAAGAGFELEEAQPLSDEDAADAAGGAPSFSWDHRLKSREGDMKA